MSKTIVPELTQEYVKHLFNYNPETGILSWKKRRKGCVKSIAGCIDASNGSGYWKVGIDGRYRAAHRIIWLWVFGCMPEKEIDHINGDRSDNRLCNLRDVSKSTNQKNAAVRSNNTSGIMGVHRFKHTRNWQVHITSNKKKIYIGTFKDFFEACCARKSAERKYGFHLNHGRSC